MRTQVELGEVKGTNCTLSVVFIGSKEQEKGGHAYGNISYSLFARYGIIRMSLAMYSTSN